LKRPPSNWKPPASRIGRPPPSKKGKPAPDDEALPPAPLLEAPPPTPELPDAPEHVPDWHVCPSDTQFSQALLPVPHAVSTFPA
jgi:hypothetical protein